METTAIVTRGLTRRFGETVAVDGVNLEVAEGRIFGFLLQVGLILTSTAVVREKESGADGLTWYRGLYAWESPALASSRLCRCWATMQRTVFTGA